MSNFYNADIPETETPPADPLCFIPQSFRLRPNKKENSEPNFMEKFMSCWRPADIIAIIVIVGGILLKLKGTDGTTSMMLIGVCFYYFGKVGNPFFKFNVPTETEPK